MGDKRKRIMKGIKNLLAVLCVAAIASGCQSERPPNVLVIMTDQQSVNTIGAYGSSVCRTPHLDRLAQDGMLFVNCHVASYPCSPSRATLLTGMYSHGHGVVSNNIPLDQNLPLLGKILKAEGYATSYFGKYHLGGSIHRNVPSANTRSRSAERDRPWEGNWGYVRIDDQPDFQPAEDDYFKELADGHRYVARAGWIGEDEATSGFDHWVGGWMHYRDYLRQAGYDSIVDHNHSVGAHGTAFAPVYPRAFGDSWHAWSILPEEHHQEAFFVREAIDYLEEEWDKDQPFGMLLSFYGPHHPLLPPKPWDDMYSLEEVRLPATLADDRIIGGKGTFRGDSWSEEQFKDYIRRYWGFTSFIDHQIGKLLKELERQGELDRTIILFTSDHGDMAGEHGSIYKSTNCAWDELMRVPLIVSYPPVVKGNSSSEALVSNVDFLPTLLELSGSGVPVSIDGKSFLEVLENPGTEHRDIVFTSVMGMNYMAVDQKWKYNLNIDPGIPDELYDRLNDPDEMNNLIHDPEYEDIAASMRQHILDWLKETGHDYADQIADKTANKTE